LDALNIPDSAGGINPGDRRAVFYLTAVLSPSAVLEIGTHIGASTLCIAEAMGQSQIDTAYNRCFITVDCVDVNSATVRPWLSYGSVSSPAQMIATLGLSDFVRFVTQDSIEFMRSCPQKFDLIFLDGSHDASVVYQEIVSSLPLLHPNGLILLHDYFPGLKPLWPRGYMIPGPALAVQRLRREGMPVATLPLGELPWQTKHGSNRTSLALLTRS